MTDLLARRANLLACAGVFIFAPLLAEAQAADSANKPSRVDAEFRVDAIAAPTATVQAGAGFVVATGIYTRPGIDAALGFNRHGLSGRVDLFTRFHLDPFRESRWGFYGGGGISGRFDEGEKSRGYLLLVAGFDGPPGKGWTPSIELGLGGGGRIGLVIRQSRSNRR